MIKDPPHRLGLVYVALGRYLDCSITFCATRGTQISGILFGIIRFELGRTGLTAVGDSHQDAKDYVQPRRRRSRSGNTRRVWFVQAVKRLEGRAELPALDCRFFRRAADLSGASNRLFGTSTNPNGSQSSLECIVAGFGRLSRRIGHGHDHFRHRFYPSIRLQSHLKKMRKKA